MPEIDMEQPGTLLGSALFAKDYTFMLVASKPTYTPQAFEQNPNAAPAADVLFKSPVIPDKQGKSKIELGPAAKTIRDKMKTDRVEAKVVLLGTMLNYPHRKRAVVENYTLTKKPKVGIELKALVASVGPNDWVCYHHPLWFVEMVITGPIKQVQIAYTLQSGNPPMHAMWEQKSPGKLDVGRTVFGGLERHDHFPGNASRCKLPNAPHSWGWWGSCGFIWGTPFTVNLLDGVTRYIIGSYPRGNGNETLTVSGTGGFAEIKKSVNLTQTGNHPHPGD